MARIAILYDTTEGQTSRIAQRMAEIAVSAGHEVEFRNIRTLPQEFRIEDFDGVIIGASVHVGKHSPQATEFVQRHRTELETVPSAFFSVSLSAAGKTERQQQNARRCLEDFFEDTGWRPRRTATMAGALLYREYGFLKRMLLKWIARREGGDTDTSRNYEYTDWDKVREFVEEFLGQFERGS